MVWSREEVSPEAAELLRNEAAAATYRVLALVDQADGSPVVRKYDVPSAALNTFLYDLDDGALREYEQVLSVQRIGAD